MELRYSFKFDNNYIFEINYTNVPKESPKHLRFQWYLHYQNNLVKLNFDKMENLVRCFKEKVILDVNNMNIKIEDLEFKLEKCSNDDEQILFVILKTSLFNQ